METLHQYNTHHQQQLLQHKKSMTNGHQQQQSIVLSGSTHSQVPAQFQNNYKPKTQQSNDQHLFIRTNQQQSTYGGMPEQQYYSNGTTQAQYYTYLNSFHNDRDFPLNPAPQSNLLQKSATKVLDKHNSQQSFYTGQTVVMTHGTASNQSVHHQSKQGIPNMKHGDKYSVYQHDNKPNQFINQSHSQQTLLLPRGDSSRALQNASPDPLSNQVRITTKRGVQHQSRKSISKILSANDRSRESSRINQASMAAAGNQSKKQSASKPKSKGRTIKSSKGVSEQIVGFYNNEKTPKRGTETIRYETNDEYVKPSKLAKTLQNYQTLPEQNNPSKRASTRKTTQNRNNTIQLKLKTLNVNTNGTQNFESLESLNTQSNIALTTKNTNQHLFSLSQSSLRSPQKESFQSGTIPTMAAADYLFIKDDNNNKSQKLQQKIQRIIKATSSQQNGLQQSQTTKDLFNHSRQQQQDNKIFRQQSLKQFVPSIDDQLMKLTEQNNKLLEESQRVKKTVQQQPISLFKGQIIKQSQSTRQFTQYNHKESIEGGLKILAPSEGESQQIPDITQLGLTNDTQSQLSSILLRTQLTLKAYKKREVLLVDKVKEQEEEIKRLRAIIKGNNNA